MFSRTYLYFPISLALYLLEVGLLYSLLKFTDIGLLELNYSIRLFACIFAALIYRVFLFRDVDDFYLIYSAVAVIAPIVATFFLYMGNLYLTVSVLYIKLFSDIIASVIGYLVLQTASAMGRGK